jgi:hypothetical protein
MASQLKTKFIKNDAVDGSKLKLKHGETLRGTDGSGNEIDILANIDSSIASVQSSVNSEVSRAQAAEGVLQTNINSVQSEVDAEEVRALAAESAISVSLSNEVSRAQAVEFDLQANIGAEEMRAIAAEDALQIQIDTETNARVAADGVHDISIGMLQGYVGNLNQQGFEQGSYVPEAGSITESATNLTQAIKDLDVFGLALQTDLDNESLSRTNAVSALQSQIDTLSSSSSGSVAAEEARAMAAEAALSSRIDVLEDDPTTKTYVDGQISGVQSQINGILSNVDPAALDSFTEVVTAFQAADDNLNGAITALASSASAGLAAEVSRAEAAEAALQSDINAEETRALAAESALSSSISSEVSRATAAEGVLDGRLDVIEPKVAALEAIVDAGYAKVLNSTDISNGYIDLPHLIVGMLEMYVDKLRLHSIGSSPDFSISTVGGVTRVTFLNNMISPSEQALASSDELFCYYKHS